MILDRHYQIDPAVSTQHLKQGFAIKPFFAGRAGVPPANVGEPLVGSRSDGQLSLAIDGRVQDPPLQNARALVRRGGWNTRRGEPAD